MKKFLLLLLTITSLLLSESKAQPYLDILSIKYANSPGAGLLNHDKNDVTLRYFNIGTNLPIQFNHKKDAVIFSPFFEKWSAQINNNKQPNYYGLGLPVTLSKSIPKSKWNLLLTAIVRMNDSSISKNGKIQVGGAFIAAYKKKEKLTWKFGLYVNDDLFGSFIMPLVGIDWNISTRDNLFGILPGNLSYEHKLNNHFYWGANFRAITNSYANAKSYWRIDENQLGLYLDTYPGKNIVLNLESGHSILRKIRTGIKHISEYDAKVNDGFYVRLSLSYRVRFKKENEGKK